MVFNTRATLAFVARRGEQQSQGSGSLPARVSPGNSHVKCSGQQPQRRYGRVLAMTGMKASGDGVVTASQHVCAPTPVSNPAMPRVVQGLEEASQRPHETAWVEMNKDNSDSGAFTHSLLKPKAYVLLVQSLKPRKAHKRHLLGAMRKEWQQATQPSNLLFLT